MPKSTNESGCITTTEPIQGTCQLHVTWCTTSCYINDSEQPHHQVLPPCKYHWVCQLQAMPRYVPVCPPKSAHSRGVSELPPDVMFFGSTWVPNGTWTGSAAFVALSHNIVNNRSHFVLCMRCGLRTSVQILPALHTPDTFQWAGMSPSKVSLPTKIDFLEDQQSLMQAVLSCKNLTSKSAECIWFWGTKSALLLDPDRGLLYPRLPQNIPISFFFINWALLTINDRA